MGLPCLVPLIIKKHTIILKILKAYHIPKELVRMSIEVIFLIFMCDG